MIKWRNLIKDLQKQRCVLLLGDALPYVDYEGEKIQLNHVFAKYIVCLLNEENIEYEKFVHSIVSNAAAIPDKIINNLKNVSLLFLGFDFESWHFRILLESLKAYQQSKNQQKSNACLFWRRHKLLRKTQKNFETENKFETFKR